MNECEHVGCGILCDFLIVRERQPDDDVFGESLVSRVQALKAQGLSIPAAARRLGVSKSSVHRRWHVREEAA